MRASSSTTLHLIDAVQKKVIKHNGDTALSSELILLFHRRAVVDLSLSYRYFHGFYSKELSTSIPPLANPRRFTKGSGLIHCTPIEALNFSILSFFHYQGVKVMEPITLKWFPHSTKSSVVQVLC